MPAVLFVTRKGGGRGGMQTYSRDLPKALSRYLDMDIGTAAPWMIFRILRAGHLHLGDAALAPLGAFRKMLNPRCRVTLTACGLDVVYPLPLYQTLMRWALPRMDAIVCISAATAGEVRARGVPASRVHVIPCGVWEDGERGRGSLGKRNADARRGFPRLFSVGRLIPRKGVAWFVDQVLPSLVARYPDLVYDVVGEGPEELRISWAIHRRKLQKHVRMHGAVSDIARDALLSEADVFVMPNCATRGDMEGFGIACIEASSRGVPVAAARIDGIIDAVIEGATGAFFPPGSAADAAQTIAGLIERALDPCSVSAATLRAFFWGALAARYGDVLPAPTPAPAALPPAPTRSALLTWDYANGKGGLGRAMILMAELSGIEKIFSPSEGYFPVTLRFGGHVLFSLILPFSLQRWIDRERITEIILPVGPGGILLLRRPSRCTLTAISHHSYLDQSRRVPGEYWKNMFVPLERRTLRMASRVTAFTDDAARMLKRRYGIDAFVAPPPFDAEVWIPRDAPKKQSGLCISVGRLSRRKGTDVLLAAWPAIRRALPHAKLVLVGKGKVRLGIEGVDHFQSLSLKDLVALVQRAEVAICPSYLEGFGYACAEAMAAGTTVVASDVPGLRSLVRDDATGRLVPPGDLDALADAVIGVLSDDVAKRRFADRALKHIHNQFAEDAATATLQQWICPL